MHPVPARLPVGNIAIAPATVLAPMAGVTDTVFRRLIRNQGGCGLIMTEFTSSHGVSAASTAHASPTATMQLSGLRTRGAPHLARSFSAPTRR